MTESKIQSLNERVDNIVDTEKLATIDLEAWPRNTLASISNTVNEAKDRLGDLKKKYFNRVAELTIGIFVLGDEAERVAQIAEEVGETLTVRADALYTRLADMIDPVLPDSREFSVIAFNRLIQGLSDVGHELDVKAMDMPKFNLGKVADVAALVAFIRETVRNAFGDDINRLYLTAEIQKKALASKFKGSGLGVVIIGLQGADEVAGLSSVVAKFGEKVFTNSDAAVANIVDKDFVLATLQSVAEKFKSKKKHETTPENK